ncbi:hypothetical protein Chls_331 [Chlamydia suis]|uniref:Uncharacterized protein n=1 Tax=Chlamydia suis TaxID=83559 RepID=A0ABX6ITD8_9CHLA|nr:hypothetical protein Chls_331 [Chlamydia suis]
MLASGFLFVFKPLAKRTLGPVFIGNLFQIHKCPFALNTYFFDFSKKLFLIS